MTINDPIYGSVKITEPVLIELIKSSALGRLKHIHQHGANYFLWPIAESMNRYNHSVGVMILIRKLKGPLEEQIAGLLHDVGHSAFSHVLDYLLDNRSHEAHEQFTEQFVATSDIPEILRKHDLDSKKIFDHNRHPLLEQPAPLLCADRVDYLLRDALGYGVLTQKQIHKILEHLTTNKKMIVTNSKTIAKLMGETYLDMDREYWATSHNSLAINYAVVEMIRRALGMGDLRLEDLWRLNDKGLIDYLNNLNDPLIEKWFDILNPEMVVVEDRDHYDIHVWPKIRLLDPPVVEDSIVTPLSLLDKTYTNRLTEASDFPEELFLRFHE